MVSTDRVSSHETDTHSDEDEDVVASDSANDTQTGATDDMGGAKYGRSDIAESQEYNDEAKGPPQDQNYPDEAAWTTQRPATDHEDTIAPGQDVDRKALERVAVDPLDRQGGHGALSREEAWVAETSTDGPNDGRSTTRTTFYASDTSTDGPSQKGRPSELKRGWEKLAKWNDGMHSKIESRASQNADADKRRWVETFGGEMGASEQHKQEAIYTIEHLDVGPYKAGHITTECLIVAILTMYIDKDVRQFENEDPADAIERRAINRAGTQDLLDDLELDRKDIVDTRTLIRKNDSELVLDGRD